ncbi:MAG TPA: HAD family phosphatase [Acidimicrobiales bacterium]|nr:HAD family phosphatase [Acidimicrobiales bacterium]
MRLEAVVFDFDGLIIDSEWVIFESAAAAFAAHGHELTVDAWATVVGTNERDERTQWDRLCAACGIAGPFDREDFDAAYERQDRSNRDTLPPMPGVLSLVDALLGAGVALGIASSSSRAWLDRHVGRLGLDGAFTALVGSDMVGGVGKPAPDVYLRACLDLGADPRCSVALEDSEHGIAAAHAAGMAAVAVPGRVTRSHDFSAADLVVASLEELTVADLAGLVPRAPR